jgi:cell division protein ZapA
VEIESADRKQVRVNILNQSFTLVTQGDPNDMIDLANSVDDLMNTIARKSPNLDSTRIAVFACLQLADQLRSREAEISDHARRLSSLIDEAIGLDS